MSKRKVIYKRCKIPRSGLLALLIAWEWRRELRELVDSGTFFRETPGQTGSDWGRSGQTWDLFLPVASSGKQKQLQSRVAGEVMLALAAGPVASWRI